MSLLLVYIFDESIATNPEASLCIVGFLPCVTALNHCTSKINISNVLKLALMMF